MSDAPPPMVAKDCKWLTIIADAASGIPYTIAPARIDKLTRRGFATTTAARMPRLRRTTITQAGRDALAEHKAQST